MSPASSADCACSNKSSSHIGRNPPRLVARETSPLGHRLGLASLMDGTVPPLPSNYRPFLLRDRNSWAETTLRATSASFIPEWKPRNGSKNIRQGRSFYFVVASE